MAAALLVPTSLPLINASYESEKERAKAIGIWAGVGGTAGAVGPVLGAMLTAGFGWPVIFFINVPIGLAAIVLTLKYVPNAVSSDKGHFDLAGQIMGIISIAALAFALIEAGKMGWLSTMVVSAFSIFLASFTAFLLIEHRSAAPMFPLRFFRSKTFSTAIAIGMILNLAGYGELFICSLYFQQVREYSVLMTGFALVPMIGFGIIASYLGGKLASVAGARLPIIIGLSSSTIGFLTLLIAGKHTPYLLLLLPLAAIGFGMTFTMPAATIAVINAAPAGRAGIASGAFNASRQIGSLMGVAIYGTIISISASFIAGMHITLLISALLCFCGSIATWLYMSTSKPKKEF
jgi:DHA2 family methylenomycin A resistance protein-like MFS transporter